MGFSLEDINGEVVHMVQACRALISQNFLYVAITPEEGSWLLTFALESESASDREAIEDIETNFEVLHDRAPEFRVEIKVAPRDPAPPGYPARLIWVRKREYPAEE
ncbi:hypothetical protein [Nevskia soli]|uniref:hypothetical protein n=1 Tax=Nevskia soli TaxID=418856 RepID=UPI0004A76F98|nr:hypothetical protein [Nevskia soli]